MWSEFAKLVTFWRMAVFALSKTCLLERRQVWCVCHLNYLSFREKLSNVLLGQQERVLVLLCLAWPRSVHPQSWPKRKSARVKPGSWIPYLAMDMFAPHLPCTRGPLDCSKTGCKVGSSPEEFHSASGALDMAGTRAHPCP